MNALVKKEIRLLLPSFVVCCAMALANLFFRFNPDGSLQGWWWFVLAFVFSGAMAVMLALNSFGGEISLGTFSNLLAQPVSRQKIWETKILLLAVSLLIVGIFWGGCGLVRLKMIGRDLNFPDLFMGVGTFGLVVFSGGLWTVLLLRQVAAAFWFTVLVPGVLLALVAGFFGGESNEFMNGMIVSVLGLYSLAGLFFARWLFFRAQDVQWSGGTIVMPEMRGLARLKSATGSLRRWRPQAALFWKEIQLHQSQFVLAGALALLHLGALATRKFGDFRKNSDMEFILEIFWGLWLVMPMLVGAAAVAEERKLGTIAGQLCLPVKRRTQFGVKLRVVLLLSVLFGAVMPLLLEGLRILPDVHYGFDRFMAFVGMEGVVGWQSNMSTVRSFLWYCLGSLNPLLPLLTLLGMATTIGAIAFYASTLARNTLQALAPTVLGIIVFSTLLINAYRPELFINYPLWHGWLIYLIGVPVFVIALVAMSFWNCQRLDTGWNVWRRNTFVFAAALAFVIAATTAIYHRAWEKLTPFEPLHGAARLSLSNPAALREQWNTLSVRLPDGRIWTDDYTLNTSAANPLALVLGDIKLTSLGSSHFLNGSNWMNVVRGIWFQWVGIKNDGTLWVSEKPAQPDRLERSGWKMPKTGNLVQFGGETNWSSLVWHDRSMLLVKNDGTLWRWGTTNWNYKHNKWPGMQSFTPYRLGTESNWAEVFLDDYQLRFRKTDGSLWTTWFDKQEQKIELEPGFSLQRLPLLARNKWRGTTRIWSGSYQLGVRDDGTFRIMADQRLNNQSHSYEWKEADLQFGKDTNWLDVAGHYEKIVTLKDEGTLWLWNFHHDYRRGWDPKRDERERLNRKPVRLGTYSDWIAIASTEGGIISLAADGSLWYWPLESAGYFSDYVNRHFFSNSDSHFEPLLDISRKPQRLGNIFGKPD
jgi:ABC-type transport system involved in multi-copper enzyme maturation permease subunit/alpha-tubulin suppressor-like RCC1 family protein